MKKHLTCLFLILSFCASIVLQAQSVKPNIIYIMADDLGIGDIGPYGQKLIKTPNLDQMAKEGMKFTNFYAGNTVCAPSRASLMTGQHSGHGLVRGNGEFPLDPQQKILPEYLKEAGYHTAMFGKWGLGLKDSDGSPEKRGWDVFAGFLHHVDAHFQKPDSLDILVNGELQKLPLPNDIYSNDYFAEQAAEFISAQNQSTPFFLYLSFTVPHAELVLPKEALRLYLDGEGKSVFPDEVAWPDGRHYGPQEYPKAAYAAMVSHLDQQIGALMSLLKEKGMEENTLVIFTSDNGTHVEGGRTVKDVEFFHSSSQYRGVKRDLYDGGIHVPFLAQWKGTIPAGSVSEMQGVFWDLLPTFTQLSGNPVHDLDGISLAPTFTGKGTQEKHSYLYWEFHEGGGKQALMVDQWKIVRLNVSKERFGAVELYDLQADPSEKQDVSGKYPERVAEMVELMDSIRTSSPNFNFGAKN